MEKKEGTAPLLKRSSRTDVSEGDARRRQKFKDRSKDLERGSSTPALVKDDAAKAPLPLSPKNALTVGGHDFEKKTFFQPTFCHHCSELLWGLRGQGLKCRGKLYLWLASLAGDIARAGYTTNPLPPLFAKIDIGARSP